MDTTFAHTQCHQHTLPPAVVIDEPRWHPGQTERGIEEMGLVNHGTGEFSMYPCLTITIVLLETNTPFISLFSSEFIMYIPFFNALSFTSVVFKCILCTAIQYSQYIYIDLIRCLASQSIKK